VSRSGNTAPKREPDPVRQAVAAAADDIQHGRVVGTDGYIEELRARLARLKRDVDTGKDNSRKP